MPLTYRRARGSDTWHFRDDCTQWPESDFDQEMHTPADGPCCVECTYWPAVAVRTVMELRRHDAGAERMIRSA
jgi:hypothetical protein